MNLAERFGRTKVGDRARRQVRERKTMTSVTSRRLVGLGISAAIIAGGAFYGVATYAQAPAAPAPVVVPRTADGKPDFTGLYIPGGALPSGADNVTFAGRDNDFTNFETDNGLVRMSDRNKPLYKPEFWQQVRENDYNGNWREPGYSCLPDGVPRLGAPAQIFQMKDNVILLYNGGFWGKNSVRVIPFTDKHNPARMTMESFLGDAIARWDGDTLVIETMGFTDVSWLHKNGYMHGFNMKVTEKLARDGGNLRWEATVDDPEYFQQPWTMNPVVRVFNPNTASFVPEDLPCQPEILLNGGGDVQHIISRSRSG